MSPTADETVMTEPAAPVVGAPESGAPVSWTAVWIVVASLTAVLASGLVFATHGTRGFFVPLLASTVCLLAAFFDAWTGRIPNPLTYTAIALGLALNAIAPVMHRLGLDMVVTWLGGPGAMASVMGFGACAVLGLLGAVAGAGVHGGDLKLLAALGALLGLVQTGSVLMLALAVAVVYAIINLALLGRLNAAVRTGTQRLMEVMYLKRFHTPLPGDPAVADVTHIPMAVPLAIGLILTQWWQWRGGGF